MLDQLQTASKVMKLQKTTEKIAYQLYQERLEKESPGNKNSDWARAQSIVRNPAKLVLYTSMQITKDVIAPQGWIWSGLSGKTSWEWLELLIIPILLATGGFYLDKQVESRQEMVAIERYNQERAIAHDRDRQETLVTYLDKMQKLLLDKDLRSADSINDEVIGVARAITATAIKDLDAKRNELLVDFLKDSNLIKATYREEATEISMIFLATLNLSSADMRKVNLGHVSLIGTNLSNTDLSNAILIDADLSNANLSNTDLSNAILIDANLSDANLSNTDLSNAILSNAILIDARNIKETQLKESYLCKTQFNKNIHLDSNRDC